MDNRRAYRRYAVELPIQVRLAAPAGTNAAGYALRNPFRLGVIKDLSLDGIYFVCPARFTEGDMVDVELISNGKSYPFTAVVRHVTVDTVSARQTYGAGAQMVRNALSTAALAAIAEHLNRRG